MTEEQKRREPGDGIRDGVRTIFGMVGALKDAIEETFQDLLEKGDLSPEKAREAARTTVHRAQETMDGLKDRLDFVSRREFETLQAEVAELRRLLEEHRAGGTTAHAATAPSEAAGTTQATPPASDSAASPPPATPGEDAGATRFTIDDA
jgi:polyhydroxyalkanoate synthesis regulator phasin